MRSNQLLTVRTALRYFNYVFIFHGLYGLVSRNYHLWRIKDIIVMRILLLASFHAAASSGLVLKPYSNTTECGDNNLIKPKVVEATDAEEVDDLQSSFVQGELRHAKECGIVFSWCFSTPSHILYLIHVIYMYSHNSDILYDGHDSGMPALSICVLIAEAIAACFVIYFLQQFGCGSEGQSSDVENILMCYDCRSPLLWIPQLMFYTEFALFSVIGIIFHICFQY